MTEIKPFGIKPVVDRLVVLHRLFSVAMFLLLFFQASLLPELLGDGELLCLSCALFDDSGKQNYVWFVVTDSSISYCGPVVL